MDINYVKELVKQYFNGFNEIPLSEHYTYIFHIPQNIEEIADVVAHLEPRKFKYFVELGSDNGGSLWLYAHLLCDKNTRIVVVEPTKRKALAFTIDKLRKEGYNVEWVEGFSHLVNLEPGMDLVHIDAGHHYHAVKGDYEKFYALSSNDAVLLMHDTYNHDGCVQFRKELEQTPGLSQTFVGTKHNVGITMVKKNENLSNQS